MGPEIIKTNGNVMLVEPNSVNINTDVFNGIPDYEDMYIFAELTAQSKGRTVMINGNTSTTTSKKVNFIGNNQDETGDNPNYLNFTTNYYDGSTGNNTHYEGFGINNIKIVINSSFIPQVSIQFVDIRGLAFFNQADSPYRILFDFPPPIFTLTVKGYYGKPVTYRLHLVKYTSEFSSANGNFIIDANFIAMTFAPLSDILFRYVINFPLIEDEISMNPAPNEPPANTYELILKLKKLYKAISKKLETDADNIQYQEILNNIERIDEINGVLNLYKENENLKKPGTPYLMWRRASADDSKFAVPLKNSVPVDDLTPLDTMSDFDAVMAGEQSSGYKSTIKNQLFIAYIAGIGVKVTDNENISPTYTIPDAQYFAYNTKNDKGFNDALIAYKKILEDNAKPITTINHEPDDINDPKPFLNATNVETGKISQNPQSSVSTDGYVRYYGMDISKYYYKIQTQKAALEKERNALAIDIATKINNMVAEKLGMIPSIYNIFKIILTDVDKLFSKLKSVSQKAYNSHQKEANKKIIIGDGGFVDAPKGSEQLKTEIYSFPLIINRGLDSREERIAPIDLWKKVEFPEMDLVNDFIDTFLTQRRLSQEYNLRGELDDDGVSKWIPISPFDSTLGGATPISPYLGISDNIRTETLQVLMKRFYMLTQGTLPDAFYVKPVDKKNKDKENLIVSNAYIKLYAKAEALNLTSALVSEKNRDATEVMATQYANNLDKFYEDLQKISFTYNDGTGQTTSNIANFPANDPKYFLINQSNTITGRVYVDKDNEGYEGLILIENDIHVQDRAEKSSNPIDNFSNNNKNEGLFKSDPAEYFFEFTKDNLLYIRDVIDSNYNTSRKVNYDGEITLRTRYLSSVYYSSDNKRFPGSGNDAAERQEIAYNEGNNSFTYKGGSDKGLLSHSRDIVEVWSKALGEHDEEIMNTITGSSVQLSSLLVLSNFGSTVSPFNVYPNALNSIVFDTPAAIEVPAYYAPYMGALLSAIETGWVNEIRTFFETGPGSNLPNRGFFILADLHDIENYMSEKDKRIFRNAYSKYMGIHNNIATEIGELSILVDKNMDVAITPPGARTAILGTAKRTDLYEYFLYPGSKLYNEKYIDGTSGSMFSPILKNLIKRVNMLIYSQLTFKMIPPTNSGYTSLQGINTNGFGNLDSGATTTVNNTYFTTLFSELKTLVQAKKGSLKEEEEELKRSKGDVDIMNQLYYSFKNINDKWLTGTAKDVNTGYPFNADGKKMIDLFAFVDRGMNPIGETIINAEILIDMMDDVNVSLFTVLSQLLSLNGFEFFPLQNFLSFESETSWTDSFKIYDGAISDDEKTYFVCMYIGGTASYPSVSGNGFQNDGIIDITEPGIKGFERNTSGSQFDENIKQELNEDFPFREVRAFRVRFGEQNQSMFTDMKIDSKEYPETNESIQILSRLAGDNNPDAGVPKGQNLYNLYENRSYKATVTGFGNATIQPTQYFQLENIPLFNGAYIILNVEHNITANKMTTSFSGTKLLKYPMPRVLTPVAFMNYDGQSVGDYTAAALTLGTQLTGMLPSRVSDSKEKGGLDSVFGVDVSHHNGVADWVKATADKDIKFAFIKLTQGDTFYSGSKYDINKQINDAVDNGVKVGYYHFAEWGNTSDPAADGVTQANNFIGRLNALTSKQKSKFPAILDVEGGYGWAEERNRTYMWSNKTTDLNTMISSFIDTMDAAGYETIIYSRKGFIDDHQLTGLGKYGLWLPNFMNILKGRNPEEIEPDVPSEWFDWDIWQFSSHGVVAGIPPAISAGVPGVDLNVMRKDFFNKYT